MSRPPEGYGRIAGIDFGTVRCGIAVTDPERRLASPYGTCTRAGETADANWFRQLIEQEQIVQFVVGLPIHLSGQESPKSREARRFGQWLAETTGLPVTYFDERYTSVEAADLLRQSQVRGKRRRARMDMLAAQILLTAYLESTQQPSGRSEPLDDPAEGSPKA
jgi:putative Holliday junction resolvase